MTAPPPQHRPAALSPNESERLAALRAYDILDTPAEPAFDDITRIACQVCETPISVINLIDSGRQWFKSEIGLGVRETPLENSICAHAILERDFFEIPDMREDPRTARNPLVTQAGGLMFYAGAVLRTPDGLALGTLCVLDTVPRSLRPEQRDTLTALARQVLSQIELRRALVLADRLQRNVSRLLAVAGHDLKQPLQVMIMTLDRMRGKIDDPRDKERVNYAIDAGMRLAEDLDHLAETSALQAGGPPMLTRFRINDVMNSVSSNWRMHAAAKSLRLDVVPSSAEVVSNQPMLRTILGNIVGNAIKYTASGRVLVGCRRRGHAVAIEVLDTGAGIADDQQSAIFEAFHQLDAASDGLGLGLSIVRRTAEMLGHEVKLRSILGHGTQISVTVPLAGDG